MKAIGSLIRAVPSYTPDVIKNRLKGTRVEEIYYQIWARNTSFVPIEMVVSDEKVTLHVPYGSSQYEKIRTTGKYEPALAAALSQEFNSDTIFFDVGAYYGHYSELAIRYNVPEEQIHTFEASDSRSDLLKRHPELTNVNVNNAFVGSKNQEGVIALDEYQAPTPDVVKIDVEGAEYDVLLGMNNILHQQGATIFIEVHPNLLKKFGQNVQSIIKYLTSNGYLLEHPIKQEQNGYRWELFKSEQLKSINSNFLLRATPTEERSD